MATENHRNSAHLQDVFVCDPWYGSEYTTKFVVSVRRHVIFIENISTTRCHDIIESNSDIKVNFKLTLN